MIDGWLPLGAWSATYAQRLGGWHGLVRVEEWDGGGLSWGSFSVRPLDLQIVAWISEFSWHPDVADVALHARRPDQVGDAADPPPAGQGRPRLGDLEEGWVSGGFDADELAGDPLFTDAFEGGLADVVGLLGLHQPFHPHDLEWVVLQSEVGVVVENAGLN